jgi:hypothetical protein
MHVSLRRAVLAVGIIGAAIAAAPAGASAAGTFDCSASAIRLSVLGQTATEPITANAGKATCQSAISGLGQAPVLPAPLTVNLAGAETVLQGPAGAVYQQTATAVGSIGDLSIKALPSLPIALPAAQLPANLNAVTVPITGPLLTGLQGLGLPTSVVLNLVPAAQALIPAQALPSTDIVDLHVASSTATASCVGGAPQLSGSSQVAGLSVLGQSLPIGQVVNQALTLINSQSISLSSISATQLANQLPPGLSFSSLPLGLGQLLQQAVQTAINGLPPIQIPATVAQVAVTPAEQTNSGGTLTQRALHVQVGILGQSIADVVLGEASVSDSGVSCATPPTATSALALQCTKRKLNLINVVERSDHVALLGAADKSLIGHRVDIVFTSTGQKVGSAIVRPDGFFRASVPLPAASVRHTNNARYQAVAGSEHSLRLKLERRMHISSLRHRGGNVVISGVVTGPLASHTILIQQRVSCTQLVTVKRIHTNADGTWSAVVPAPAKTQAAVYRATTQVLHDTTSSKQFPTFTLPGYVSL